MTCLCIEPGVVGIIVFDANEVLHVDSTRLSRQHRCVAVRMHIATCSIHQSAIINQQRQKKKMQMFFEQSTDVPRSTCHALAFGDKFLTQAPLLEYLRSQTDLDQRNTRAVLSFFCIRVHVGPLSPRGKHPPDILCRCYPGMISQRT
jgi:hypothetical protein